jgi:hypothetical protein
MIITKMFFFPSVQNERQQRIVDVERNRQSMISLKVLLQRHDLLSRLC